MITELPRLKQSSLPVDHLSYAARSKEFRGSHMKVQKRYMKYRRAMIKRDRYVMAFKEWRVA